MSVYKQRVSNVKKEKAQLDVFNEIWQLTALTLVQ